MPPPSGKRLGKGLGALLGESAVDAARSERGEEGVRHVAVTRIRPNRHQPRRTFRDEAIADLAASVAQKGILQPILVTPHEEGGWELVSGERRWRAARKVGLTSVPVVVRDVDDRELLEIALIENLQREDLDPIEEAAGYRRLLDEFGATQAELAERIGKSRPAVANALRLLELPEEVLDQIREGSLTAGHGRALLGLDDRSAIPALARRVGEKGWTVRRVERHVRKLNREVGRDEGADEGDDVEELERIRLEEDLQRELGTKVRIHDRSGKGRIEIAFYSHEDLERLVARLRGEGGS